MFHCFSWTHATAMKKIGCFTTSLGRMQRNQWTRIYMELLPNESSNQFRFGLTSQPTCTYVPANSVFEIFIACRYYKVGSTQLKYIRYWFCLQKSVVKLDIWDMSCMYVGLCVNKGYGHTVRCVTNTLHELVQFHCGSKCACMDVCTSSHMRTSRLRLWHQTTVNTGCCRVFMEPVP